jgi:uncharacterized protein YndB with AHSA1/START domain
MADILQEFPIRASREAVYRAVSDPASLDRWWTKTCRGEASVGGEYELGFGPGYDWRARVTAADAPARFELELVHADGDWLGSRVAFDLDESSEATVLRFAHTGWPDANAHFRISCHCWALYLRVLRRWLEHGEVVAYEDRLDV